MYSDIQTDSHVPLVLSQVVVPVVLSNGQTEVETIVQTFRQTLHTDRMGITNFLKIKIIKP